MKTLRDRCFVFLFFGVGLLKYWGIYLKFLALKAQGFGTEKSMFFSWRGGGGQPKPSTAHVVRVRGFKGSNGWQRSTKFHRVEESFESLGGLKGCAPPPPQFSTLQPGI